MQMTELQENINELVELVKKYQMKCNVDKYSAMHIGHNNMQGNYNMFNQQLPTTDQQRDLGIIITIDLKWQKHTEKLQNSHQGTEVHFPNFMYKNKQLIISLYKSLVHPHLRDAMSFSSTNIKRVIDKIERVHRSIKIIPEIRNHTHNQRIKDVDTISLEQRRLRGNLIKVFKYLYGFTTSNARGFF